MQIRTQSNNLWAGMRVGISACVVTFLMASAARAQLAHRYSFSETGGTAVADSVGSADGILINGSGNSTFSAGMLNLGNDGNIGSTAANIDYVDLPNNMISALSPSASFEAWVVWDGGGVWQRIYDFGASGNGVEDESTGSGNAYYTFVCPQSGPGVLLSEIACIDGQADQQLGWTGPMPTGTPVHVAVVLDESLLGYTFYLNGRAIAFTGIVDFRLNLLNDNNNWLGRSQWPDTMFNGAYDEMRIYDNPLTAGEVLESYLAGPDAVGTVDLGDPLSANLIGPSVIFTENTVSYGLELDYATETGVVVYADANVSYSSSDTNVATISANGTVEALAVGTTTLEVNYGTLVGQLVVEVEPPPLPPAELMHRYSFNSDASGVLVPGTEPDLVGTADGDIWGGQFMGPSDPDNPGTILLDSIEFGYIDLPNGLISSLTNATIEMWVKPNDAGNDWQRFWDIGTTDIDNGMGGELGPDLPVPAGNGLDYWMLTSKVGADSTSRLEMNALPQYTSVWFQTPGNNGVPRGQEHHLVAVYNASAGVMSLTLNGQQVGEATVNMPLSELPDLNVWIGRSNWQADGFVNAYYNEFRVYEGVLTALQVAINQAAGPDTFIDDPGSVTALTIEVATTELQYLGLPTDATAVADYTAVSGIVVDSIDGVVWMSDDTNVVTVGATGLITPIGIGTANVSVSFDGQSDSVAMTVAELVVAPNLAHRYSFSEAPGSLTVLDSVGGANGIVDGTDGVFDGSELNLPGGPQNGTNAYVDLPNGMISALGDQITIELWTTWEGSGSWGRVYSFGDSLGGEGVSDTGQDWLDLITQAGDTGRLSFDVAIDGAGTGRVSGPTALPQGVETHVVGVVDAISGINRLYIDGQFIGAGAIENAWTVSGLNDINNWLGRGQWGDPRYFGSFNEFRVYTGLLSDTEVADSYARGPDNLTGPVTVLMDATLTDGVISITWPSTTPATLQSTTGLGAGGWSDAPGTPVETDGVFRQDVPAVEPVESFRLTD